MLLLALLSLSLFALVSYSVLLICYSAIRLLSRAQVWNKTQCQQHGHDRADPVGPVTSLMMMMIKVKVKVKVEHLI